MTDDIDTPAPVDGPVVKAARWQAVAFVCGRCEDRKGAPKSLDGKRVGKRLREGFRDARLRSRVVSTGCLGLCPRGALAVAISVRGGPLVVAELSKKRDALAVVEVLVARSDAPVNPIQKTKEEP